MKEKAKEFAFIDFFIRDGVFDTAMRCRQLRALWTSFCIRFKLEPETVEYENKIESLKKIFQKYNKDIPDYEFREYMEADLHNGKQSPSVNFV